MLPKIPVLTEHHNAQSELHLLIKPEITVTDPLIKESNRFINIAENYIERMEKENESLRQRIVRQTNYIQVPRFVFLFLVTFCCVSVVVLLIVVYQYLMEPAVSTVSSYSG